MTPGEVAMRIEHDFQRLLAATDALEPERQVNGWTVKQTLGHIAAWDREVLAGLRDVLAGRPAHYAEWDEDDYNRAVTNRLKPIKWETIREEAVSANAALCAAVRAVSASEWQRSVGMRWPDGTAMTAESVFAYTYKGSTHYAGHAGELEAAGDP